MISKRFLQAILAILFVCGMIFSACESPAGAEGGDAGGGNTDPKTLILTGITQEQVNRGSAGMIVGVFPAGTGTQDVFNDIVVYLSGYGTYKKVIAGVDPSDPDVEGASLTPAGNAYTAAAPLYGRLGDAFDTSPWTGSGTFDVWIGLSDGANNYLYRAENITINQAGTAVAGGAFSEVVTGGQSRAETPRISIQPIDAAYSIGEAASPLTVAASVSDGGTLSYQWYKNTSKSGSDGTSLGQANGANTASYTPPTNEEGTFYYYAEITNTNNNAEGSKTAQAFSSAATVTVVEAGSGNQSSWSKWTDPKYPNLELDYLVDSEDVVTVTVDGQAAPTLWSGGVGCAYGAETGASYTYVFEAWTDSGERILRVQYQEDPAVSSFLFEDYKITSERKTYTLYGTPLLSDIGTNLDMRSVSQLGTFHVKIISVTKNPEGTVPAEALWRRHVPETGNYWVDYSIMPDGVCDVDIVGPGTTSSWVAGVRYRYTEPAVRGRKYTYSFEAWTDSGTRNLDILYYWNNDTRQALDTKVSITSQRKPYSFTGEALPFGGEAYLEIRGADKLGGFYIKILEIVDAEIPREFDNLPAMEQFLATCGKNTAENPIHIKLNVDLSLNWSNLTYILNDLGVYITLDLSDSLSLSVLDPAGGNYTGKSYITSLILPDMSKSIAGGFEYFTSLKSISGTGIQTLGSSSLNRYIETVDFPNLTTVGNGAFSGCTALKNLNIPSIYGSIGDSAFYGCASLTSLTLPNAITSIGDSAFTNCTALSSLTLPNTVTSIGNFAFVGCTGITTINIPDSVKDLGYRVFSGCVALESVVIGNGVTSIGESSFSGCIALKSVVIGSGVSSVALNAFTGCTGLSDVTINTDKITRMTFDLNWAVIFKDCAGLTVIFGEGVTVIGDFFFYKSKNIVSVSIPASVTSIKVAAFGEATSLARVIFGGYIAEADFYDSLYTYRAFPGDVRAKYFASDGGPGIYIAENLGTNISPVWTKLAE